jgi:hypothetical protein
MPGAPGEDQHQATIPVVGNDTAQETEDQYGHKLKQAQKAQLKRVTREFEDMPGNGYALYLGTENRDAVSDPEKPKVPEAQCTEGVGSPL